MCLLLLLVQGTSVTFIWRFVAPTGKLPLWDVEPCCAESWGLRFEITTWNINSCGICGKRLLRLLINYCTLQMKIYIYFLIYLFRFLFCPFVTFIKKMYSKSARNRLPLEYQPQTHSNVAKKNVCRCCSGCGEPRYLAHLRFVMVHYFGNESKTRWAGRMGAPCCDSICYAAGVLICWVSVRCVKLDWQSFPLGSPFDSADFHLSNGKHM